jgi:hypothetical protein
MHFFVSVCVCARACLFARARLYAGIELSVIFPAVLRACVQVLLELAKQFPSLGLYNAIAATAVTDPDEVLAAEEEAAPAAPADESSDESAGSSDSSSDDSDDSEDSDDEGAGVEEHKGGDSEDDDAEVRGRAGQVHGVGR